MDFLIRAGVCALAMVAALVSGAPALADQITAVRFGVHDDYTRVVIESDRPMDFRAFTLSDPAARVVIALPGARWSVAGLENGHGHGHGLVGSFRFDPSGQTPRLILELNETAVVREEFTLAPGEGGHRMVIDLAASGEASFTQASGFPEQHQTMTQLVHHAAQVSYVPPSCEAIRVVIDPGHGGRDPGAPGRFGGAPEKTVALNAGLALRDALLATGRYEVIMTRDTDVFLELNERIQIAQGAEADLFISLHADASPSGSSARGAAVYTLSDHGLSRARSRAITEGDWFLSSDTRPQEVNNLLLDMSLQEKRNQSLMFADMLLNSASSVGPLFRSAPLERGFYVLLDSQVPAILFEMGFLTNETDSRNLNDPAFLRRLMGATADSIDSYFQRCGGGEPRRTVVASGGAADPASR